MGRRSGEAVAAQHRHAGAMKHRCAPRGGARAEDYSEEIAEWEESKFPVCEDWEDELGGGDEPFVYIDPALRDPVR